MEDGTTQGKMKRKGMINPKFNAINVINIYEYRSSTNNMEGQTNYVKKKKKAMCYWHMKEKAMRKKYDIFMPKQVITCVNSKTCLLCLMNQKVAMLLLEMHSKFQSKTKVKS